MIKKIIIFIHTEYHLLVTVNQFLRLYNDHNKFEVELYIIIGSGKRLLIDLDFTDLPIRVNYLDGNINLDTSIDPKLRREIDQLMNNIPDIFIFFQEQDLLSALLSSQYSKMGTEVCLYQDGFKPYLDLKLHSIGLLKHHHSQNVWLKKNNYTVDSWISPVFSNKYAFLKSIHKIYLTSPECYKNWNNKKVEKIEFLPIEILNPRLKKLFKWEESLLPERENIILYITQPLRNDGDIDIELLNKLGKKYPGNRIYLKLHPRTDIEKINRYKRLRNVEIINSKIIAELFIMNIKRSIVMSAFSTAMLINNPDNKFYYLYKLYKGKTSSIDRIRIRSCPANYITAVKNFEEIKF